MSKEKNIPSNVILHRGVNQYGNNISIHRKNNSKTSNKGEYDSLVESQVELTVPDKSDTLNTKRSLERNKNPPVELRNDYRL